ncbi:MAG TPA: transporter [Nitrospirota bacterium]|nr:transporter [Nitrospirota bacterium]
MSGVSRVAVILILLLVPAAAWAAHPLDVEDAETEGKGRYSLEFTGDYVKDNGMTSTETTVTITAGAAEDTDLSLEVPYLLLNPSPETGRHEAGFSDLRLKLKHRFYETPDEQSLAYLIHADLPTGDEKKGLGSGKVEWGGRLIGTKEWDRLELHLNAGYESHGSALKKGDFTLEYAVSYGLAAEYEITEPFELVVEVSGERRKQDGQFSRPLFLLGGAIYELSESWYVDVGLRAGLNTDAEDYALLAGVAYGF